MSDSSNPLVRQHARVLERYRATPGRIVVTVHDTGRGPADHLAGLVPAPSNIPGRGLGLGLWAMHQLDIGVALRHTDDGFTVRLRSGTIPR
jgi:anti-sigma regulatory factor (Ser/Thr protein kinase)